MHEFLCMSSMHEFLCMILYNDSFLMIIFNDTFSDFHVHFKIVPKDYERCWGSCPTKLVFRFRTFQVIL